MRCIIMSCSKRKRFDRESRPAVDMYDGVHFRVLRRFFREHPNAKKDLLILIVSAKYGVIDGDRLIRAYDRPMTAGRAKAMNLSLMSSIDRYLTNKPCNELFLLLSADYLAALSGVTSLIPSHTKLVEVKGPHGVKAAQLKRWLYSTISETKPTKLSSRRCATGKATIRGQAIALSPAEVFARLRQTFTEVGKPTCSWRDWFVLIDGEPVGPKWIVSQLSGLHRSSFTSGEARRVLNQLGIKIERNTEVGK